eukprot:m.70316 g.70316  ORF g.70316 m.70316 type:complete len:537 (+) comp24210_c0_seq1:213-1823(+)
MFARSILVAMCGIGLLCQAVTPTDSHSQAFLHPAHPVRPLTATHSAQRKGPSLPHCGTQYGTPPSSTARSRACDIDVGQATTLRGASNYVINPADYGGDPSGVADSTAALQHCVELLWNASRPSTRGLGGTSDPQLDLGGATLDLAGGVFLISSPIVFPSQGARNFQVRGGTLRAASTFPETGFLLELNYTEGSYVENAVFEDMVFDGGRELRGGGLCTVENLHVRVQGCWFLRFGTTGLYVLNGHELYVDDTWLSQATFAGDGTCGGNGTGIQLMQADGSVSNSVIFCTKLGIHLDGGNVILENLHVYNTGHYHYREDSKLMPFGAVWSHYANGIRIIGGYFDDCIVVLDNPRDVVITASTWLLGGWSSEGGVVLRAIQGHGAPRPILRGLRITDSYMQRMPSFPSNVKTTQFVWFDGNQGKFNDSVMVNVVLANNVFDVAGLDALTARTTRGRKSVRVANATLAELDFSDQLLFPGVLAAVQVSVVFDSNSSGPSVTYRAYQVSSAPLTVTVAFSGPASGLVTVDVDQSAYDFQ